MNPEPLKRVASAVVPLSLFLLAYVLLSPPSWVAGLKHSLDQEPGLAVIDDALPYDPSDLQGLIWLPESALKKSLLKMRNRIPMEDSLLEHQEHQMVRYCFFNI